MKTQEDHLKYSLIETLRTRTIYCRDLFLQKGIQKTNAFNVWRHCVLYCI